MCSEEERDSVMEPESHFSHWSSTELCDDTASVSVQGQGPHLITFPFSAKAYGNAEITFSAHATVAGREVSDLVNVRNFDLPISNYM